MTELDRILQVTTELGQELEDNNSSQAQVRTVPSPTAGINGVWRVVFELAYDSSVQTVLDIRDEIVIGRDQGEATDIINLVSYDEAEQAGVSRRHLTVRPTQSQLYIADIGSTNGTRLNGDKIGQQIPYSLNNGDYLEVGRLELIVRILKKPGGNTTLLNDNADFFEVLTSIASSITAQTTVEDALKQAIEMTIAHVSSTEASIWLVDVQSGELFLEAEKGIEDENIHQMRLSVNDTIAGDVIRTGKPIRVNSENGQASIKVKTGYLVNAMLYVPLKLGGVAFGVLSAAHREGDVFNDREEKLMMSIAELTAIAVQNARHHESASSALARKGKILTALNYVTMHDLKHMMNATTGYVGMLEGIPTLEETDHELVGDLHSTVDRMAGLLDRIQEVLSTHQNHQMSASPFSVTDIVRGAIENFESFAESKGIKLALSILGQSSVIQGSGKLLQRSIHHLIDNAIRYSPENSQVSITLAFENNDTLLRICDEGPGIPEEDLPYLFDFYYRGQQSTGLGLGLELARTIIEAHRGTLSIRNLEDAGVEVTVSLPASLRIM